MLNSDHSDYLKKLLYLEQNLRNKSSYSNLSPFNIKDTKNIIEVQKAASILARHIGLVDLLFVVNYSTMNGNVGGQINLDNNNVVLINISDSILDFPECVLATLAHEITHKFLHINNLSYTSTKENEIFTDLTAVYLGFGEIMIKGQFVEKVTEGYNYKSTRSQRVGYLNSSQLSFIYLIINCLNDTNSLTLGFGIPNSDALFIWGLKRRYKRFLFLIRLILKANNEILKARLSLAYLVKMNNQILSSRSHEIESWSYLQFQVISDFEVCFYNKKTILFTHDLNENIEKETFISEFHDLKKTIQLIDFTKNIYKKHLILSAKNHKNNKYFKISEFECPNCNKKLNSKSNKIGIIICPNCHFKFAADTTSLC